MDPPESEATEDAGPPHRRRQSRRNNTSRRKVELFALSLTFGFAILTCLKEGQYLHNNFIPVQNLNTEIPSKLLPPCKSISARALQESIVCFQKCEPVFNQTIEGMGLDPNEMINITTTTSTGTHTGLYGKYRVHFPEEGVYLNITTSDREKFGPRAITERLFRRIIAKLFRARVLDASKNIINTGSWIGDNAIPWALMLERLSAGNGHPPGKVIAVDPSKTFVQKMADIASMNSIGNLCARIGIYSSVERAIHTVSAEHMVVDVRTKKGSEVLNAVPLDSENIVNVTLLHLDVEGHESEVLTGARKLIMSSRPVIVTEGFSGLNHPSDITIATFLESLGYTSNEIPEVCGNDLYCRNHIWWPNEKMKAAAMKVVGDEFKRDVVPHISPKLMKPSMKQEERLVKSDYDISSKFCGRNKWLGTQISCNDRVAFLVNRHHYSEQQAKINLLKDNCQCSLAHNSTQYTDILQRQQQVTAGESMGTFQNAASKIPQTLIFVDTRFESMSQFPRLVHENVQNTLQLYSNYWNNSDISVWFLGDEQCQQVIEKQNSDLLQFYQTESFGPFKSDICRIAALSERGGYYFDNDMEVVEAMSLPNATFITVYNEEEGKMSASNTFIAATPRHVIFEEVINAMVNYYKTNRRTLEENNVGPTTLWEGYDQAAKKYCDDAGERCNTWSIFDLTQVNLDVHKELYAKVPRRKGWGCCCNFVIHNPNLHKMYFWSRFLGAGGSCRFRGGKTADDIE